LDGRFLFGIDRVGLNALNYEKIHPHCISLSRSNTRVQD